MDDLPPAVRDADRLAAVKATGLVGTGPEESLDRLARLASLLLDAPCAYVTLVDTERSWYKSLVGAGEGARRWGPVEESFCQYVIAADAEVVVDDARLDGRTRANPSVSRLDVVAWAGFPVRAPTGEVLGTLCVLDTVARQWTERDREVLETLASAASAEIALRVALSGEREARSRAEKTAEELAAVNERLVESQRRLQSLARALQGTLLPPHLPAVPGVDVAASYRPAVAGTEVTGDFYDVFQGARASWAVVMGDVCGKGPEAAKVTALARYTVRASALRTTVPDRVLDDLNRALLNQGAGEERFVTAAYATLRRRADGVAVSVALAGHPPPLVRRAASGEVDAVGDPGLPAGLFDDLALRRAHTALRPGDVMVFYTDGLIEARYDGQEYGAGRLRGALAAAEGDAAAIAAALDADVEAFRRGASVHDDTAVLVVRVPPR